MVQWFTLLPESKEVLGSNLFSVWCLYVPAMSAWVPSGCSGFLTRFKDTHVNLTGESELLKGENVSVKKLCVSIW